LQVTVVVPSPNIEPDAGVQSKLVTPTASLADAVYMTVAPAEDAASAVMSAGTVIAGAVVSCTVTWNDLDDPFPAASLALQVTVVVPSPKVEPDAGEQLKLVTPTASLAEAA
jgi:hypothetical protein